MSRQQTVSLLKKVVLVGIYGGLLLPLVFIPQVVFPFVFSKLITFQILIGLTLPAYLALAWMEPQYRPPKAILYYAIVAYFVAVALSVVFSIDPLRSWWGNQERMNGLYTLLHFLAWLTMTVGLLKTWLDWKRLLNFEIVISVLMATVALLQVVKPDLLLFPAGPRVGGLLDNPIYMGGYQIFNLAFLALLFLRSDRVQYRTWYLVAAMIDFSAFLAAQSRGALVGLAALIGVFALYYAFFTKSARTRWTILGAALGSFSVYVMIFLFRGTAFVQSSPMLSRLTNFQFTTRTRFIAWDIAWQGFLERPWTGWGFDTFHLLFNLKYNPASLEFGYYETWFDRAHNTVMDVLAMTGVVGFITFFGIFVALFFSVRRAHKRGWIDLPIAAILTALPVGYFLQNLFVFDHPAAFSMSYLLFALVIVATRPAFLGHHAVPETTGKTRHLPLIALGIVQFVCVCLVWQYSIQPFRASASAIRYNSLFASRPAEAWEEAKRASSIPTPYIDEQAFLLARNVAILANNKTLTQYPEWEKWAQHAKELNERQLAMHPQNAQQIFAYARLLQDLSPILEGQEQQEMYAAAEAAYQRAIAASPKRQQLYFGLAQLYTMAGRDQEAYDTVKKTVEFNPNIGESWWYVGVMAWRELGRADEGIDAILQAVHAKVPYVPTRVIDVLTMARAAATRGDTEALEWLFPKLESARGGSVELFLDIARAYEQAGLVDQRNTLLNVLIDIDATLGPKLQGLRDGSVETIDASLQQAKELGLQVTGTSSPTSSAP